VIVRWCRGKDVINYDAPSVFFVLGTRGSGKSSLLESIGESFIERGHSILDLFGSRDGEGLAWLRSPAATDAKILLLKGENVDVSCSYETRVADSLTLHDLNTYNMIISASPMFANIAQEFSAGAHTLDVMYRRLHYSKLIYCVAREAANLFYSRLRVSENQLEAKSQVAYLLRESRHLGVSMGLDSLRFSSVDVDVRTVADFTFLKSQGAPGLGKDLRWMYKFVSANMLRDMQPQRFVVLSRRGAIGYGVFKEIPWHKTANEDILRNLGFRIEYSEMLTESVDRGRFKTVGDAEHVSMILAYVEEGMGYVQLASRFHRSSRTPLLHVDRHNLSVQRSGFCAPCKRAHGKYAETTVGHGIRELKTDPQVTNQETRG